MGHFAGTCRSDIRQGQNQNMYHLFPGLNTGIGNKYVVYGWVIDRFHIYT